MFTTSFTVEFGDCDEAGIVYYPNYFYWFDCTFHRWLRTRGLSHREMKRRFGGGTPLVDATIHFSRPLSYDDEIQITVRAEEWQEKRFRVAYEVRRGETSIARGSEVRAWVVTDESGRLKGAPIPDELRQMIGQM
jgi:YbgC/YbaW family acyl-CoA thioester hydrolase